MKGGFGQPEEAAAVVAFRASGQGSYVVGANMPKSQRIKSPAGIWRIGELIDEAPVMPGCDCPCGDGPKEPRAYDWAGAKLPANIVFDPGPPTHHRWVMARHSQSDPEDVAYYLAYAPWVSRSPSWLRWQAPAGRSRNASRPRRAGAAWTSTRSDRYVGWYRHITLAMFAHAFLTALAAQPGAAAKRAAETDRPSSRSP